VRLGLDFWNAPVHKRARSCDDVHNPNTVSGVTMKYAKLILGRVLAMYIFCSLAPSASATEVIPATLDSMTANADMVMIGTVEDHYSYMEHNKIFTNFVIQVDRFVKNCFREETNIIEIKVLGGQVGDLRFEVDKAPALEPGQQTMLFLRSTGLDYIPFGFHYGVFYITSAAVPEAKYIHGPWMETTVRFDLATRTALRMTDEVGGRRLVDFINQVEGYLE
jgi:hypothetical protein